MRARTMDIRLKIDNLSLEKPQTIPNLDART